MYNRLASASRAAAPVLFPAPGEPPVDRAVRRAGLDLALETADFDTALKTVQSLLEALHRTAEEAGPEEAENAVALFLLLSRRVCDSLCGDGEEEEGANGDAGLN